MTGLGIVVALSTAAAWAGFDAARKHLVVRLEPIRAAAWVNLVQGPLFVGWGLATGTLSVSSGYAIVGGSVVVLQIAANTLLFRALSISGLSSVVPMLALTPVFASFVGILLLDQHLAALQWLGVVLVVASAFGMHGEQLRKERGVLLALAVAVIWSVTTSLDKLALEHASVPVHAAVQSGGVGLALALGSRSRPPGRRAGASFGVAVVLGTAALALQLWAIQLIYVGLVETIKRALGLVSSVVLGRALFGEAVTMRKIAGIVGLIVGTALLVLGEAGHW